MTEPPTGVNSFPVMTRWGMEKLVGSRQGAGLQRMLCLDQVPSLWQVREAVCVDKLYPSSHLEGERETCEDEESKEAGIDMRKTDSDLNMFTNCQFFFTGV